MLFAGFGALLIALAGPLPRLADHSLFSLHITQILLLTIVAPPLLLLGLPPRLWARVARHPALVRSLKFWGHPILGGGLFALNLVFWHLTPFFTMMMLSPGIHFAAIALLLATALLAWWPVCCPLPAAGRIPEPAQMIHLFVLGVPIQVLAAVITISGTVLYPWYGDAPRAFGLTPLADQQLGGLLLWVPGGLGLWIAITVVWLVWARRTGHRGMGGTSGPEGDEEPPLTLPRV